MDIVEISMFTHKQRGERRDGDVTGGGHVHTIELHLRDQRAKDGERHLSRRSSRSHEMKVKYATSYNANPLFGSRENEGK